ncbi:hypothetical protein ACFLZF_00385 [Nanoarchaeota archaeon]
MKEMFFQTPEIFNKISNISKNNKFYKVNDINKISNSRIVSMIPGDLLVAGCFNFFGGIF